MQEFLEKSFTLKEIKRQGWIDQVIKFRKIENIADHVFGVAFLSVLMSNFKSLDEEKTIKMAILHDLAESIVGDITPRNGISDIEKFNKEKNAMLHLNKLSRMEILAPWLEFEKGNGEEARFVRQLDKLEMLLQAVIYQAGNDPAKLDAFWDVEFRDNMFQDILSKLKTIRKEGIK